MKKRAAAAERIFPLSLLHNTAECIIADATSKA